MPDAVERYEVGKSSVPSALNSTPIARIAEDGARSRRAMMDQLSDRVVEARRKRAGVHQPSRWTMTGLPSEAVAHCARDDVPQDADQRRPR